jgi:hypothetical protein
MGSRWFMATQLPVLNSSDIYQYATIKPEQSLVNNSYEKED